MYSMATCETCGRETLLGDTCHDCCVRDCDRCGQPIDVDCDVTIYAGTADEENICDDCNCIRLLGPSTLTSVPADRQMDGKALAQNARQALAQMARISGNKTPADFPWFGCQTDEELEQALRSSAAAAGIRSLEQLDGSISWGDVVKVLEIMYFG